ncbi:MAG TPA: APC family permease [Candidatus Dormibacteraeota bacterium]|nr:APC family permease [Candidatus Dormibacteraeota bacterium]
MVGPVAEVAMRAEQRIPSPEGSGGGEAGMARTFHLLDLSSLSISSVGPLFSIAATGGVMAAASGYYTVLAIMLISVPFIISAFVFRLLNRHFPHAGASYHWAGRILGRRASRFQACVLLVAYFASIPPIIIPAATYTKALLLPHWQAPPVGMLGLSAFWVAFALIPLLAGGRPTARITQAFLALEAVAILVIIGVAIARWPALHVAIHPGPLPIGGLFASAIIASTILDGWEIDSYAAEESRRPRADPGTAGIIGAVVALVVYLVIFPLLLGETPMHLLAHSSDPMSVWGTRLLPQAPWLVLIPVLASTAGGLWLTSFILTRALFAMSRDGLLPQVFSRLSRRHVPAPAILIALGAALLVTAGETLYSSLAGFFGLVLASAGFFLTAEFFLDSVTASVFLTRRHRREWGDHLSSHEHRALQIASTVASVLLLGFLVGFVIVAPRLVGVGVDAVIAVVIGIALVFALARGGSQPLFVFQPDLDGPAR